MAFHNVRLPDDIEKNATGGPRFKTNVVALNSGDEQRNIDWSQQRCYFDIGYSIRNSQESNPNLTGLNLLVDFFYARQGRAHSFRFKDWTDYTLTAVTIGNTDTSTAGFQIFKRYTSGAVNFDRIISKPLSSGAVVLVNGVGQTVVYDTTPSATEVSINSTTGILTLGTTHTATNAQSIVITTEFDVAVRFDTDNLDIDAFLQNVGAIPSLPVVEVRNE